MNPVIGVISITAAAFGIFLILSYERVDKRQMDIDRNFKIYSKTALNEWIEYLNKELKDDKDISEELKRVSASKKTRKTVDSMNRIQELLNRRCKGDGDSCRKYNAIRKESFMILKNMIWDHNNLAERYNNLLKGVLLQPLVKIFRMKDYPLLNFQKR